MLILHDFIKGSLTVWFVGDWRQLYELGQEALQEKAAGLGKRLRAMTQAEAQARQTRNVEVRSISNSRRSQLLHV